MTWEMMSKISENENGGGGGIVVAAAMAVVVVVNKMCNLNWDLVSSSYTQ